MSDDYKVQISGDIGNGMFVLRGDSVAELVQMSKDLSNSIDEVYENLAKAKQVAMVKDVFSERKSFGKSGGGAGGGGYNKGPAAPAAVTTQTPDGGLACAHGPMKAFDFTNAEGKRVAGHNCPLPKGTTGRCKAVMA